MNYFKCIECWRVYDKFQLLNSWRESCDCGSLKFKEDRKNLVLRRILTDYKYCLDLLINGRLFNDK